MQREHWMKRQILTRKHYKWIRIPGMLVLSNYSSGIQGRSCCLSDAPSVRLIFRNQLVASNKVNKCLNGWQEGWRSCRSAALEKKNQQITTGQQNLFDGIDKACWLFAKTLELFLVILI